MVGSNPVQGGDSFFLGSERKHKSKELGGVDQERERAPLAGVTRRTESESSGRARKENEQRGEITTQQGRYGRKIREGAD